MCTLLQPATSTTKLAQQPDARRAREAVTPSRTAVSSHRRCRGVRGRRVRGSSARRTTLPIQAAMIQAAGVVGQPLRQLLLVGPQQKTLAVSTAALAPVAMAMFLQGRWRCQPSLLPLGPRELGPWRRRRRLPGESPRAPFGFWSKSWGGCFAASWFRMLGACLLFRI